MYLEVMGKPLLNELQEPVTLFLVDDPVLLSLQDVAGQPLIYARRQGSKPKSGNSKQSGQSSALISAPAGDFDPVIIESTGDKEGDVAYACSILELAAQNLDILEPFERLKLAMEKVHKSKEMDKK